MDVFLEGFYFSVVVRQLCRTLLTSKQLEEYIYSGPLGRFDVVGFLDDAVPSTFSILCKYFVKRFNIFVGDICFNTSLSVILRHHKESIELLSS